MTNYQTFLLVSFAWAILNWGTMAYVVFILGNSGWWFVLSAVLSIIVQPPEFENTNLKSIKRSEGNLPYEKYKQTKAK